MAKMTESELQAALQAEERSALGYLGGALSEARKKALNYYLGEPFGNEIKDRSQVVSTDVADTIEWILPGLVKIFTAGDEVVEFQPTGPEDEEGAKQASDYCNWVAMRDNPGFLVLHEWFKDALLQKLGIIKAWWDDTPEYQHQTFYNLPTDSLQLLKAQEALGEITIESETPVEMDPTAALQSQPGGVPADPSGMPPMFYDVEIRKTKSNGKACIEAVPPEEFLISRRARGDIEKAHYLGHRRLRTQSDLIEDGYDKDQVEELSSEYDDITGEALARDKDIDEQRIGSPSGSSDRSTREIWVTEAYILIDYDGDGIAERRKITHAGSGATILKRKGVPDNHEWEGPVPFATLTPIVMPHRLIGRSVADLVMDIQLIKSTLMRQGLDNAYLINNKGHIVDPAKVWMEDVLSSRPGRVVRTKSGADPATAMVPIEYPSIAAELYPLLEYMDTVRESRTGVSRASQGLDADVLSKSTAHAVSQITTSAAARVELIARVFAETGVKRLFKLILWLICTYQDKPRTIKLRNKWVPIDPTEWDEEMDVQINVGLGTGNRDAILAHLAMLGNSQQLIVAAQGGLNGPLITPKEVHGLFTKQIENAGFKNPEAFVADPATAPPQQPKPDPKMMEAQANIALAQQKAQGEMQQNQAQLQMSAQQAQQKLQQDAALQIQRMQQDHATETAKALHASNAAQAQMQIDIQRMRNEYELKAADLQNNLELKRAELAAEIQLRREKNDSDAQIAREKAASDTAVKHEQVRIQGEAASKPAVNIHTDEHVPLLKDLHATLQVHHGLLNQLTAPKKRTAVAHRGADGRITHAELVEQ